MLPIERYPSALSDSEKQNRNLLTLLTETEKVIHHDPDIASAYLNQAIAMLAVRRPDRLSQRINRGGLARWQVTRIDEFIKEHLDNCIRTSELASLLGLSVSHFSHAFKQTTGVTPLRYVTAVRVETARQYMLCSARPLSEIALRHGFCDQSHFCRVFRRQTGLAPQAWRKLQEASAGLQTALPGSSSHQATQLRSPL